MYSFVSLQKYDLKLSQKNLCHSVQEILEIQNTKIKVVGQFKNGIKIDLE